MGALLVLIGLLMLPGIAFFLLLTMKILGQF